MRENTTASFPILPQLFRGFTGRVPHKLYAFSLVWFKLFREILVDGDQWSSCNRIIVQDQPVARIVHIFCFDRIELKIEKGEDSQYDRVILISTIMSRSHAYQRSSISLTPLPISIRVFIALEKEENTRK